jgi:hypothetical protein
MTDYANIPDANTLHQQREIVTNAIAMLDSGGNLTHMTVSPKPYESGDPPPTGRMYILYPEPVCTIRWPSGEKRGL